MYRKINLNADLGENYGAWVMGNDADMLPLVSSANLACGFHRSDPLVMRQTLQLARRNSVSVGAHPSYPNLQGFRRRRMAMATGQRPWLPRAIWVSAWRPRAARWLPCPSCVTEGEA